MNKRVSIREVAKKAKVSPGTVSNFLNNSTPVNADTRERIVKAIDLLGYQRNEIASSLRRAQTNSIGLILPDIRNPFYADLYYSIENAALENGYTLIYGNSDYSLSKIKHYLKYFSSRRVDSIILSANYSFRLDAFRDLIDTPMLVFEPHRDIENYPSIGIDNQAGSRKITEYLIDKGHKDIAILTSSKKSPRYKGYEQALNYAGIEINPKLVHEFGPFTQDLFSQGYSAMNDLLSQKQKFSACFVISDMLAIGAMSAIKSKGMKIPEDIAIAGFDDIPFSQVVEPALTTIAQPVTQMGLEIFNTCMEMVKNKNPRMLSGIRYFDTQLIIRESA